MAIEEKRAASKEISVKMTESVKETMAMKTRGEKLK